MHTVLIIDDQQDLLDITRMFLERFGEMSVDTAKSAKEALAKMKDRYFDALVVDYDLPDISGIEFLKIIRAKGDTTPIIIFTGVGRENAAIEALNGQEQNGRCQNPDLQPPFLLPIHCFLRRRFLFPFPRPAR